MFVVLVVVAEADLCTELGQGDDFAAAGCGGGGTVLVASEASRWLSKTGSS